MEEFESDDNAPEITPPTQQRVATRAIVLAAIAYRGILEADAQDPDALILWRKIDD